MKIKKINVFILAFILCFIGVQSSTQYIDRGVTGGIVPHQLRDRVVTTKESQSTSYSNWVEKGSHSNLNNNSPQTFTYSYSETNSRTFSMGAGINKEILGLEVSASIGGSLSWSKTDTLSGSANVPGKRVAHAYIRKKIITAKFKHVIQRQSTDVTGKWVNSGSQKTSYSTVKTTTPEIKIDIKTS